MTSGRGFVGRSNELDELKSAFRRASGVDGAPVPQVVAVVGESGFGKTRLVQELYLGLTRDPEWDPPEWNYWPDAFGGVSGQLRVNPEMAKRETMHARCCSLRDLSMADLRFHAFWGCYVLRVE